MIKNILIDILFFINKPVWGFMSNLKYNISREEKVAFLKPWLLAEIVIGVGFWLVSVVLGKL